MATTARLTQRQKRGSSTCLIALLVLLLSINVGASSPGGDSENQPSTKDTSYVPATEQTSNDKLATSDAASNTVNPLSAEELQNPSAIDPVISEAGGKLRRKRYSNFVRVGKSGNFVRIGKSGNAVKRYMHRFIRIGRSGNDLSPPWSSSDDDSYGPYFEDLTRFSRKKRSLGSHTTPLADFVKAMKRASKFVRIGKSPSSFVRIGKSESNVPYLNGVNNDLDPSPFDFDNQSEAKQASGSEFDEGEDGDEKRGFVRIGKSDSFDEDEGRLDGIKRASSFVRIGKSNNGFDGLKRASAFVRIGKSLDDEDNSFEGGEKRGFVRIGKSGLDNEEIEDGSMKRASSFVRIGKSNPENDFDDSDVKRSHFVRIGKSGFDVQDRNEIKRTPNFVRIGKSGFDQNNHFSDSLLNYPEENHGASKRGFVRIGKSWLPGTQDLLSKRAGNFVRIGKSHGGLGPDSLLSAQKKGFVRIGKKRSGNNVDGGGMNEESLRDGNLVEDDGPINLQGRGFVRIGKIPSSAFVRIGKNTDVMLEQDPMRDYSRGSRGGHSSFVRIGK